MGVISDLIYFLSSVAVPTKLRVERWSFSFMELLNDPLGKKELLTYLEKEFSGTCSAQRHSYMGSDTKQINNM